MHDGTEDGGHVATRQDFTDEEWAALQKGLMGSGTLVSVSDRDLTDTFGEASALGKYLAGQQVAATNELVRELAKTRGNLRPDDEPRADAHRDHRRPHVRRSNAWRKCARRPRAVTRAGLGPVQTVADAKGGEVPIERR